MVDALPSYVEQLPEYEVRNGQLHICIGPICLVMPFHVYLDSCEQGKAAIADWHRERLGITNNVVRLLP